MTRSCSHGLPRVCIVTLLSIAGVGVAGPASGQDFEHDRTRPATLVDRDIVVREVAYTGPEGESTDATLVTPARPGRYPAVLFVHWYGPEDTNSNRTQYVPDALALARQGMVSLLIDTPWSEPTWFPKRDPAHDKAFSVAQVKRLRRAMDVLAANDRVDPKRLAYVGHDFGAMYGAIVAGLDPRITRFVFVAGTSKFADWFTLGRKLDPAAREAVYKDLATFDPVLHVARITGGAGALPVRDQGPVRVARGSRCTRRGRGRAEGVQVLRVRAWHEHGGDARPRRLAGEARGDQRRTVGAGGDPHEHADTNVDQRPHLGWHALRGRPRSR